MNRNLDQVVFLGLLSLLLSDSCNCLTAKGRYSLQQALRGVSLEKRHEKLKYLGELFFHGEIASKRVEQTPIKTAEKVTNKSNSKVTVGASIGEINQIDGIAEYLFQGDINLTEKQMQWLEDTILARNITRKKRQLDRGVFRWTNKRLFYFFDTDIDDRKRALVKDALSFIRDHTCLDFTESSTAANRVRVFNGAGCFATIGMTGGIQELSLGSGCESVGIAAHEFAHALGAWHTQMRDDRDSFLQVDLSYVPTSMLHNYIKLPSSQIINYTPYEYGSYLHYDAKSFATKGNSLIPLDSSYLRTLGSRLISFYDIKMLNDHYRCNDECNEKATICFNDGVPNPRNCAVCNCPVGYGGALCNQRPSDCGETLTATSSWQTNQFTYGNTTIRTVRDDVVKCTHWINAPYGKRIQIYITSLQNFQCHNGCTINAIEPKTLVNKAITNPSALQDTSASPEHDEFYAERDVPFDDKALY